LPSEERVTTGSEPRRFWLAKYHREQGLEPWLVVGPETAVAMRCRGAEVIEVVEPGHDEQTEDDEQIARLFHETYERLAPEYGYKTREASAVSWEQVPVRNHDLMVAVAGVVAKAVRERTVAAVVEALRELEQQTSRAFFREERAGISAAICRIEERFKPSAPGGE
jgi:hypothetical protein